MRRAMGLTRILLAAAVSGAVSGVFAAPTIPTNAAAPVAAAVSMIGSTACGTASGFCFSPSSVTVTVGAPVAWTNMTGTIHTATDDGATWDTGIVNPSSSANITFSTPGTFTYHCSIHADMQGSVVVKSVFTTTSTQQYSLANSDGSTWVTIDATNLVKTVIPSVNSTAILGGNVDLWTNTAGYNQDVGLFVSDNAGPDQLLAWKESGGFAGTFSPNAAFVQSVFSMTAGHTYIFKLKWKTNKPEPGGVTIFAAAGGAATGFSPTRLTAEALPAGPNPYTAATTQQYTLSNNDGSTWMPIDATNLVKTVIPSVNSTAILGGNVDLWTNTAGYNQDVGLFVSDNAGPDQLLAWKESGGFAGTFSPNAAFVQSVFSMTAGHTYIFKLKWKTNKPEPGGVTIFAAAGGAATGFSPTRLTAEVLPAGPNPYTAATTQQYRLSNNDGSTWMPIDATNLVKTVIPSVNSTAILGGNVDLWTNTAGYNQDVGLFVSDNAGPDQLLAWKESGGFAGTFSPNAAFVQSVFSMTAGHTYVFKLKWKTNKTEPGGVTIFAAAGPMAPFSPTRLTVKLSS